jgi:hypothetical protein
VLGVDPHGHHRHAILGDTEDANRASGVVCGDGEKAAAALSSGT